jgi:hypothetical protein
MPDTNSQSSSTPKQRGTSIDPLDRLRSLRVRPDRARDLQSDMAAQLKVLRKVSRTESALIDAWNTAAPDELTKHCKPLGLKAGRLEISVPDAAQKFQADRWLRSGGLAELSALAKVPLRGVRLHVGANTAHR